MRGCFLLLLLGGCWQPAHEAVLYLPTASPPSDLHLRWEAVEWSQNGKQEMLQAPFVFADEYQNAKANKLVWRKEILQIPDQDIVLTWYIHNEGRQPLWVFVGRHAILRFLIEGDEGDLPVRTLVVYPERITRDSYRVLQPGESVRQSVHFFGVLRPELTYFVRVEYADPRAFPPPVGVRRAESVMSDTLRVRVGDEDVWYTPPTKGVRWYTVF